MLTEAAIKAAKPRERPHRLWDRDGLYCEIAPSGSRLWRLKFRWQGRERRAALGTWPDVSLKAARLRAAEIRRDLADGRLPQNRRQKPAGAPTFADIAQEWQAAHMSQRAPGHREKVEGRLRRYILPALGHKPLTDISAADVLAIARAIESAGKAETARRVVQVIGQALRFAESAGHEARDVTRSLHRVLQPRTVRHMPAPVDAPGRVGEILCAFDEYRGEPETRAALRLLPYLFCRSVELRTMRWTDLELQAREWRLVTSKTRQPLIVPLAQQVAEILEGLRPLTGTREFVLASPREPGRPISDMSLVMAYRRCGIARDELVPHGWRALARTWLVERLGFPVDAVEHQLGHVVRDPLGRAYNRTQHLDQRRQMMQSWADHLDALRAGQAGQARQHG